MLEILHYDHGEGVSQSPMAAAKAYTSRPVQYLHEVMGKPILGGPCQQDCQCRWQRELGIVCVLLALLHSLLDLMSFPFEMRII